MEKNKEVIFEISTFRKVRVVLVFGLFVLVLTGLFFVVDSLIITFSDGNISARSVFIALYKNVMSFSLLGLFFQALVAGLVFVPIPIDLSYIYALSIGRSALFTFLYINVGLFISNSINYFFGYKLSGPILNIVSKPGFYSVKRFFNRFGTITIFLFNILPMPAEMLSFALGVTKYNFLRFQLFRTISYCIKAFLLYWFFRLVLT